MSTYLASLLAIAKAHPELLPLVVYPLLTALVSFFHTTIEPKYPRLVAFLRATGLDLPKLWAIIRGIEPKLPPLPPGLSVLALALCGCSAAQVGGDINAGIDLTHAICTAVTANDPSVPGWVQFLCTAAGDVKGKSATVFVKSADAPAFAKEHAATGKPTP
jgi:hypothetical protein